MLKNFMLILAICLTATTLTAKTIYVQKGGTGNGTSWEDATEDLAAALFKANIGDEVWVAKGTYYPANDGDRTKTFTIYTNIKVYGGFTGTETSREQRNSELNTTILSGDIGIKGDHRDNSYTVVYIGKSDKATVLDGFIIANGTANNASTTTGDQTRCGGGMYINGEGFGKGATPTIANCTFQNNYGRDGGAVYNNGKYGEASPTFINCKFYSNKADLDGGAMFNDGRRGGMSSPNLQDCVFDNNLGNYGGAICNYGGKGISSPSLNNCTFKENRAYLRGGGIFNMDAEGVAQPSLTHCHFVDNTAKDGKGMYTFNTPEVQAKGMLAKNTKSN